MKTPMKSVQIFAALLLTALLCPPVFAQEPVPTRISRDWKRIAADGLEVVGNAPENDLRRVLKEITAFRSAVKELLPSLEMSPREPTTLVVFRDAQSFGEFVPRDGRGRKENNVGGYFSATADRNYLVVPLLQNRDAMYRVVFHEYMHHLINHNFRDVPLWLNEGMAEFYSTFEVRSDGRPLIGRAPDARIYTLRSGVIPPLSRLLSGESALRLFENDTQTSMFYAQSWLFVHYISLVDGGARSAQIGKFLELLRTNKSASDAAREAFGTSLDVLDREVRYYTARFSYPALLLPPAPRSAVDSTPATAIAEGAVSSLKARLLLSVGGGDDARKHVAEALTLAPTSVEAMIAQGLLLQHQELDDEAIERFEISAAAHRDDFAAQYYYGTGLLNGKRYTEAASALNRALEIHPRSHFAWFQLALASLGTGDVSRSDAAMKKAQELHSTPGWYYGRAQEAAIQHQDETVIADATTFINHVGGGETSGPYAAFLAIVAGRRIGREAEGLQLLERILPAVPPKSWARTVAQYMKGELTDEQFLDRAKDNGQRTEARAYIGFNALHAGRVSVAKMHFQWIKEKGDRNYSEYRLAVEELERLES